jgi:26S proteasome regulatory subunit N12
MSDLKAIISELHKSLEQKKLDDAAQILSRRAKRALLEQNVLFPSTTVSPQLCSQAREILELGAITSLRQMDSVSFVRYYQQLQPFYDFERDIASSDKTHKDVLKTSQRSKITGLYLLLLLSSGDTSQFHTVLEGLIVEASLEGRSVEDDPYIKYPVELERSLMEGSYDKVWRATKSSEVPTEDFGLFSNVWFPPMPFSHFSFANIQGCRCSLELSDGKSPIVLRQPTNLYRFQTQRIFSSLSPRVQ